MEPLEMREPLKDMFEKYALDTEGFWAKVDARRAELAARFGDKYPNCQIGDGFIHDYDQAAREDAACRNCKGVPCAKKKNQGFKHRVTYLYNNLYLEIVKCRYVRAAEVKAKIQKNFALAQIPSIYVGKTFEDYVVTDENKKAVGRAKLAIEKRQGVYFYGDTGRGKTYLSAIIAQELLKDGRSVVFSNVTYLLRRIRASFNENSQATVDKMIETLIAADLLVLDDVGTEQVTGWAVEQIYSIIDGRCNEGKQTIVTSNYDLDELEERLNDPSKGKKGVTGSRIVSRLRGMCKKVRVEGVDWREVVR